MSVTLKQRTWRTADGDAVGEGHPDAAFLVGPAGATVTDDQARKLGLHNGNLPKGAEAPVGRVELTGREKLSQDIKDAEAARDNANPGEPADQRDEQIKAMMLELATGKDQGVMTGAGVPDARVLSARLEFEVKAEERDKLWAEVKAEESKEGGQ